MIENTNEDFVNEKGKRVYVYKRKHNISNDPNKKKIINKDKNESNNCKIIIIIILLLLLIFLILFLGIFFGLKIKKRDNNIDNNNLDNELLNCDDGYVLANGKCIKYSFKATYQTKSDNAKIKLMNYIPNKMTEMIVDGFQVKEKQNNFYTFPLSGNHIVYILINITNCTSLYYLFREVTNMTSITFTSEFNTENVENMNSMFEGCSSLISINFSNLNTKNVKNMNGKLHYCYSLYSIDFSNLDLRNVKNMYKFCFQYDSLALTNYTNMRTLNVSNYVAMFGHCYNLTSIELPNFKTKNIDTMFDVCQNLRYINIHSLNCQSYNEYNSIGYGFSNNGTIKINNNCVSSIQKALSNWSIIIS